MAEKTNANIGFENKLWEAACVLWGHIPTTEYRQIIIGLIFLRYISNAFDKKYQELVEEGDGFEDDRDAYMMDNIFFVPEEARWNIISANAHSPEIGIVIDSDTHWTVWFDSELDTEATAHKYLVRKETNGKDLLPMRVICPDVLAGLQPGDEMYGQVVAYVKKGTISNEEHEKPGEVYTVDDDLIQISGKICDVNSRCFCFGDVECDFLELDVETEMGLISVLAKAEALDKDPDIDDFLSALVYISMDVAVPSKRIRQIESAFYQVKEYLAELYTYIIPPLPADKCCFLFRLVSHYFHDLHISMLYGMLKYDGDRILYRRRLPGASLVGQAPRTESGSADGA